MLGRSTGSVQHLLEQHAMHRYERHTNFCLIYRGLFLTGTADGKSAAKDGAAIAEARSLRLDTHDDRRPHPSELRNLKNTNQAERRQSNRDPHTRGGSSRLKRSNGTVDCGIRTLDRGKEKNDSDAEDGQDHENNQLPSNSIQDHRSVT
jgi:hypothetical protein